MKQFLFFIFLISQIAFGVTAGKAWRVGTGKTQPSWGAINLADTTNAVTGTLPASSLGSNPNFTGVAQTSSKNVVVSNTNGSSALAIVRGHNSTGCVTTFCGAFYGDGFTCVASNSCKIFTMTFTHSYSTPPSCTCAGGACSVTSTTGTAAVDFGASAPSLWSFICVGPR